VKRLTVLTFSLLSFVSNALPDSVPEEMKKNSRELSAIKRTAITFAYADEKGDFETLLSMLSKGWRARIATANELSSHSAAAFAIQLDKGDLSVLSVREQIAGRKIERVCLFLRPDRPSGGIDPANPLPKKPVAIFILTSEEEKWKVLYAAPSRLQPLFQDIFEQFLIHNEKR
jgi:hypothetical protein